MLPSDLFMDAGSESIFLFVCLFVCLFTVRICMAKGNLCVQTSDLFVDARRIQVAKVFFLFLGKLLRAATLTSYSRVSLTKPLTKPNITGSDSLGITFARRNTHELTIFLLTLFIGR